ncbi:transposase domain-containing protein, partial [Cupriavidus sp. AcVe19-6a]|uniref:transposase domain-containing protein n=1 Tax=Cupriavidus sp. AcVe19-6a TaxID=2821358 RepID=UPI001AE9EE69
LEGHSLQGRCPGARQSAGSAETRRLRTGHDQPSYTRFDFISDPCAYVRDVLARLPNHLNSRINELLPPNWHPAR